MNSSSQGPNTHTPSMDNKSRYGLTLLTTDNPVFCCFLLWASVLVVKMLVMALGTGLQRLRHKVFPNKEDIVSKNVEVQFNNPHVERVRRAHRNDMENILPFFTMALLYITTDPNPTVARNLFRVAAVARIIHTLVYAVYPVPQPARALAFATMFAITIYMAFYVGVQVIKYI